MNGYSKIGVLFLSKEQCETQALCVFRVFSLV